MKATDKKVTIHTHLGLGDMFICNGLIRRFIEESEYETYFVVCKKKYASMVSKMYSDDSRITVTPIPGENEYSEVANLNLEAPILRIGHENLRSDIPFDQAFYEQLGFTISDKYDRSHVCRDLEQEEKCYQHHLGNESEYIFVHDESSSGKYDLTLDTDLKIVRPSMKFGVLDYLKIIENAKEIHCLDSSFFNMIDLCFDKENMFFHKIKHTAPRTQRDCWTIINYENN